MNSFKYFSFLLVFFIISCNNLKDKQGNCCLTKYPIDSADYKLIKFRLYKGKDGSIYEKKIEVDKFNPPYCYSVLYDKYINKYYDDSLVRIPLDSIIDLESFVSWDYSSYSKDKNNCYYYFESTDGGIRSVIDNADPVTFKPLKYCWWASDKNSIFYGGHVVKGLNIQHFEIIQPISFPDYIKDDKHVFYHCDSIIGADPATFKLSLNNKFDAEDKNHKYEDGKIVP